MAQIVKKVMHHKNSIQFFLERVRKSEEPVIGIEHLIFIEDQLESPYVCTLCCSPTGSNMKKGNANNMVFHAVSSGHRLKAIALEFPTVHDEIRVFTNGRNIKNDKDYETMLSLISKEIFNVKRAKRPLTTTREDFEKQKEFVRSNARIQDDRKDPALLSTLLGFVKDYKIKKRGIERAYEADQRTSREHREEIFTDKLQEALADIDKKFSTFNIPEYHCEHHYYWAKKHSEGKTNESNDLEMWKIYFRNRFKELKQVQELSAKITLATQFNMLEKFKDEAKELERMTQVESERWEWLEKFIEATHLGETPDVKPRAKKRKHEVVKEEREEVECKMIKLENPPMTPPESPVTQRISFKDLDFSELIMVFENLNSLCEREFADLHAFMDDLKVCNRLQYDELLKIDAQHSKKLLENLENDLMNEIEELCKQEDNETSQVEQEMAEALESGDNALTLMDIDNEELDNLLKSEEVAETPESQNDNAMMNIECCNMVMKAEEKGFNETGIFIDDEFTRSFEGVIETDQSTHSQDYNGDEEGSHEETLRIYDASTIIDSGEDESDDDYVIPLNDQPSRRELLRNRDYFSITYINLDSD